MARRFLLDTNAAIALIREPTALRTIARFDDPFYLSIIAAGELSFGAYRSDRVKQNLVRLDQFLRDIVILPFGRDTADEYGRLSGELRRIGRPIPVNDIWIAAQARLYGLPLVTRDKHFQSVDGLTCLSW